MKNGLVVVDMQKAFEAATNKLTIENVRREIRLAKHDNMPIFILEYGGNGRTLKAIRKEAGDDAHFITKRRDDGSDELMDYISEHEIEVDEFIICGVNSCCCVARTVKGLIRRHERICHVVSDACNCVCSLHEHLFIEIDPAAWDTDIFQDKQCNIIGRTE